MKTRVLIVDDEPIARRGIRRYLAKDDDIEVVGEAANGISAVEQIHELHPDIVFLDVQMPDLDGFGVIENVEPSTGPAPVYIFVTAHDAHAIRAFEVHAVDYLLKPHARSSNSAGKQIKVSNHCSNPSGVSARWNALW